MDISLRELELASKCEHAAQTVVTSRTWNLPIQDREIETKLLPQEGDITLTTVHNGTPVNKEISTNQKGDYILGHLQDQQDKPWSFVVALASFFAQSLLGGYCYTGGIFYTIFRQEFPDAGTVAVSWLCTLPLTLWFIGSPIGSIITNKFGCRICSLIGGTMASVGLSLCYIATDFYLVFLFYGILAGLGNGIHYVGFITAVGRYFNKYRPIANILTTIGLTFGIALYSFLVPYLSRHYKWNSILLILGGISFNICTCACLLFPLKKISTQKPIFNFSILKQRHFLLFCVHCIFCNISNGMTFLHVPAKILSIDLSSNIVSLSLTLYGVCNCLAKILLSICNHVCRTDVIVVYTLALTICGFATTLFPIMNNMFWMVCVVAFIGLTYSVCGGHYLEVTLQLVGQDNFSDGVGIAQIMKGVGTLIAGPLAGILFKETMNYDLTFYVSGCAMVFGCLLMLPIILKNHCTSPVRTVYVTTVYKDPVKA